MDWKYYRNHLQSTPKGKKGDLTPLFRDGKVFSNLINDLYKPFKNVRFDKVAGLDAIGFVVASAMAYKLSKGMITVRKGGQLPLRRSDVHRLSFVDYSKKQKTLEIAKAAVKKGERILIVDDWIETGAQIRAAIKLLQKVGGEVVGISTIGFEHNKRTASVLQHKIGYICYERK